eukprot:scaffold2831_cov249-Ochromonas_danica.AAC.49
MQRSSSAPPGPSTGSLPTNPCQAFTKLSLHKNRELRLETIQMIDEVFSAAVARCEKERKKKSRKKKIELPKLSELCKSGTTVFARLHAHCSDLDPGLVRQVVLVVLYLVCYTRHSNNIILPSIPVDILLEHKDEWEKCLKLLQEDYAPTLKDLKAEEKSMLLCFYLVLTRFLRIPFENSGSKGALVAATSCLIGCGGCTHGGALNRVLTLCTRLVDLCSESPPKAEEKLNLVSSICGYQDKEQVICEKCNVPTEKDWDECWEALLEPDSHASIECGSSVASIDEPGLDVFNDLEIGNEGEAQCEDSNTFVESGCSDSFRLVNANQDDSSQWTSYLIENKIQLEDDNTSVESTATRDDAFSFDADDHLLDDLGMDDEGETLLEDGIKSSIKSSSCGSLLPINQELWIDSGKLTGCDELSVCHGKRKGRVEDSSVTEEGVHPSKRLCVSVDPKGSLRAIAERILH